VSKDGFRRTDRFSRTMRLEYFMEEATRFTAAETYAFLGGIARSVPQNPKNTRGSNSPVALSNRSQCPMNA